MNEIMSKDPVNMGRQPELDMAKAIIVFFLAFIHCIIECVPVESLESGIPFVFDSIIGGPLAAPMFMFAMGVGLVYTRNTSVKAIAIRGLKLELMGFVFNLCRFTIPSLIGYAITQDAAQYLEPLVYKTFCIDILQFSGLAMLLIAALRWLKVSDALMFIIALGMSLVSMLFNGVDVNSVFGNIVLGFFIGAEDAAGMVYSDFPLMNWFIVPVVGYLFGKTLLHVKDKKKFYLMISPALLLLTIVYFINGIQNKVGMFGEGQNCYYHIITSDVLISLCAVIGLLGVYYAIHKYIPTIVMKCMQDISRNMTYVYCIHWVIIGFVVNVGLYVITGTQELSVPAILLMSFIISVVSILIAHIAAKKMKARTKISG